MHEKDVFDLLAAAATRDESLSSFPVLEPGDIAAALEYAARQSDHPVLPVDRSASASTRGP